MMRKPKFITALLFIAILTALVLGIVVVVLRDPAWRAATITALACSTHVVAALIGGYIFLRIYREGVGEATTAIRYSPVREVSRFGREVARAATRAPSGEATSSGLVLPMVPPDEQMVDTSNLIIQGLNAYDD